MILYIEEHGRVGKANITAGTNSLQYPVSNVVDSRLTRVYRTDAATTAEIIFDMLSPVPVSGVVIGAHNITSGATEIKLQGNTSNSWGAPAFEISAIWNEGFIYIEFPPETYQFWRLVIIDALNPDLYIEIGRLWIGSIYNTPGISYLIINDYNSTSVATKSRGGQTYGDIGYLYDRFQVRYPMIKVPQREKLRELFSIADVVTPFFIRFDRAGQIYGMQYVTYNQEGLKMTPLGKRDLFTTNMDFVQEVE